MNYKETAKNIVTRFVDSGHIYDEESEKVERAIRKSLKQVKNDAIECCAKVAVNWSHPCKTHDHFLIAEAIRALKNKESEK